jgi:virginiamycin B lyase
MRARRHERIVPTPDARRRTAAQSSSITEYSLGPSYASTNAASGPQGIVAGPDGALWFTVNPNSGNLAPGLIGRITTAGHISMYPTTPIVYPTGAVGAGNTPVGIAVGNDGALWFTEYFAGSIGRMTTAGVQTNQYLVADCVNEADNITDGPDGALWFTSNGGEAIGRITTGGSLTYYPIALANYFFGGGDIAAGPHGALWFTGIGDSVGNDEPKIGRITTSGAITEFSIGNAMSQPAGITAGPDGALWFTDPETNSIGRMTTTGSVTEYPLPTASSGPNFIAEGPDGALWFTEYAVGQIGRIGAGGSVTEYAAQSGSLPNYITAGPDGNMWFTDSAAAIGKVTLPRT